MRREQFVSKYPRLYHMATAGALPQIEARGLLSSEATLDLLGIVGQRRDELLAARRSHSVLLESHEYGSFVLRDQKPMRDEALATCLVGMTKEQWYRMLNGRVFMWATRDRVETLLGARAYRSSAHLILTIDTATFLEEHANQIELSTINSGSTLYNPPRRGVFTFTKLTDFEVANGNKPVVEVTVPYRVPNMKRFILASETRKATN